MSNDGNKRGDEMTVTRGNFLKSVFCVDTWNQGICSHEKVWENNTLCLRDDKF